MHHARRLRPALTTLVALSITALGVGAVPSARADTPLPLPLSHLHFNALDPLLANGDGTVGESTYSNPSSPICSTSGLVAANVNTDCEGASPHNETSIAINPTNPANVIGSANDYQLRLNSGGSINESVYSRAHVSFDGGATWTTYPVPYNGYNATGDPAVAVDTSGTAYLGTLGFRFSQGRSGSTPAPDILVAHSSDGGKTWSTVRVASGSGSSGSVGAFNDKDYLTAWGNGNAIVTWTIFNQGQKGSYISSPIYDSVTHDGGNTWSAPTEISGAASFCYGGTSVVPAPCQYDQGAVPAVAADGSIYVGFESAAPIYDPSDPNFGADQYLVVKVDPATGQRVAGPFQVAQLVDGVYAYPINAQGRQTYQDSQFRTWSLGNVATDPTNAQHLAVIWSDMRNSTVPAPADPYAAMTNSDVVVSQSFDRGMTWSAPVALTLPGDQFMPWGTYDTNGKLRVGFFDRSYDPANHKYGYTIATETTIGSLAFTYAQVTTTLSDPTQGDRWFSGITVNPAFPHPTSFLGDYSNITGAGSSAVAYWTDMRNTICFGVACAFGEDAYFGAAR